MFRVTKEWSWAYGSRHRFRVPIRCPIIPSMAGSLVRVMGQMRQTQMSGSICSTCMHSAIPCCLYPSHSRQKNKLRFLELPAVVHYAQHVQQLSELLVSMTYSLCGLLDLSGRIIATVSTLDAKGPITIVSASTIPKKGVWASQNIIILPLFPKHSRKP